MSGFLMNRVIRVERQIQNRASSVVLFLINPTDEEYERRRSEIEEARNAGRHVFILSLDGALRSKPAGIALTNQPTQNCAG